MAKATRKPARQPKAVDIDLTLAAEAVNFADALSVDQLAQSMAALQTRVQGGLAQLSAELLSKLEESKRLDTAIDEKGRRFKELTGKEHAAVTLDELSIEIENMRNDLAREKEQTGEEWAQEQNDHLQHCKRIEEEAKYAHAQLLARHKAEYESTVQEHQRLEKIRQEDLLRGWNERELALKNQEEEVVKLKAQVEAYPKQLEDAVAKATAEATNRIKTEYEHKIALLQQQSKAAIELAEQQKNAAMTALSAEQTKSATLEKRANDAEARTLSVMQSALSVEAANKRANDMAAVATGAGSKSGK